MGMLRHAGTGLAAALVVGGLALLAEEHASVPRDEILSLTFLPEAAPLPAPDLAPDLAAPAFVAQEGRFGAGAFTRVGEGLPGGSLFLEAARVAAGADGLAVVRSGRPGAIATPLGSAETLPVTLEDRAGAVRACLAFRIAGAPALSGVHCPGTGSCTAPSAADGPLAAVVAEVVAALSPPLSGGTAPACPAAAELDGNRGPTRASFPQPRRDRVTKATERSTKRAGPNS